jgi:hypothetical protein
LRILHDEITSVLVKERVNRDREGNKHPMSTTTPTIVQRTIIPFDETPTESDDGPDAPASF